MNKFGEQNAMRRPASADAGAPPRAPRQYTNKLRHWAVLAGQELQRLALHGLGTACWGCETPLAVGDLGPWCTGCAIAVESGQTGQLPGNLPLGSLWTYAGAVAEALGRAKSRGHALPLAALGEQWRDCALRTLRQVNAEAVCAMPPQKQRLAERGWSLPDQLAIASGLPVRWPLQRLDSQAPRRLDRLDLPEFSSVIASTTPPRLLIVDDVVTTGASLQAARQALERAGWQVAGALVMADARPEAIAWALGGAGDAGGPEPDK